MKFEVKIREGAKLSRISELQEAITKWSDVVEQVGLFINED